MARLFVATSRLGPGALQLEGDEFRYLIRVLRLRRGEPVELFDGCGRRAAARVAAVTSRSALLEVEGVSPPVPRPEPRLTVAVALIKNERLDWCVEKLVELGVARVVPVQAERCTVRLNGDRAVARRQRLEAIARAAAAQSRGLWLPEVEPVLDLAAAIAHLHGCTQKLILWEEARDVPLKSLLAPARAGEVALLVGPEGGFTAAEVQLARDAGFAPAGLGATILRAETAAMAAAAITIHLLATPEPTPPGQARQTGI